MIFDADKFRDLMRLSNDCPLIEDRVKFNNYTIFESKNPIDIDLKPYQVSNKYIYVCPPNTDNYVILSVSDAVVVELKYIQTIALSRAAMQNGRNNTFYYGLINDDDDKSYRCNWID